MVSVRSAKTRACCSPHPPVPTTATRSGASSLGRRGADAGEKVTGDMPLLCTPGQATVQSTSVPVATARTRSRVARGPLAVGTDHDAPDLPGDRRGHHVDELDHARVLVPVSYTHLR